MSIKKIASITLFLLLFSSCNGVTFRKVTTFEYKSDTAQLKTSDTVDIQSTGDLIHLSNDQRQEIRRFISQLVEVETNALKHLDLDIAIDSGMFSENMISRLEDDIQSVRDHEPAGTQYKYDPDRSFYVDMWQISNEPHKIFVQGCEYWGVIRPSRSEEWKSIPQELEFELVNGSLILSNATLYDHSNSNICQ